MEEAGSMQVWPEADGSDFKGTTCVAAPRKTTKNKEWLASMALCGSTVVQRTVQREQREGRNVQI